MECRFRGVRSCAPIIAVLGGAAAVLTPAVRAHGQAPVGARLEVSDRTAVDGTARLGFFVLQAPNARFGRPGAPAKLSGKLEVFYAGATAPGGTLQLPSPWSTSTDVAAKFYNDMAPAGPTAVKRATIRPGRSVRVVSRGLGGLAVRPPGPAGINVRFTVTNASDGTVHQMCTQFSQAFGARLQYDQIGPGARRLKAFGGVEVPCRCMDGAVSGDETDVDCGGGCAPCIQGGECRDGADCESGVCASGSCAAASCDDGVLNGGEIAVDCGGPCAPCAGNCSPFALQIIDLLNQYRASRGKDRIPASPSMCEVSDTHAEDLAGHWPYANSACNLHSWSKGGPWTGCCYPGDPNSYQCMWEKPRELSSYPGYGYEVAAAGAYSPEDVLNLWKGSAPHNDVLLNNGVWKDFPFHAVGAGQSGPFAVMWFGEQVDPAMH